MSSSFQSTSDLKLNIVLFNPLSINLRGSCLIRRYATTTSVVATNQIPFVRFPTFFALLTPGLLTGCPLPCLQPSIHMAVYSCLQYWHSLINMMLTKYHLHPSRSHETGVDLVLVIKSMFHAITRLQRIMDHSQPVCKMCVLQPGFTGTT